jgi:hypothetical protein
VAIYQTVAVRTSQGAGIGPKRLPPDEAGRLVRDKHAVYGDKPPRGFQDGGAPPIYAGMMPQNG